MGFAYKTHQIATKVYDISGSQSDGLPYETHQIATKLYDISGSQPDGLLYETHQIATKLYDISGSQPDGLLELSQTTLSLEDCRKVYGAYITNHHFCTSSDIGGHICLVYDTNHLSNLHLAINLVHLWINGHQEYFFLFISCKD